MTSNMQTNPTIGDISRHNLKKMLDAKQTPEQIIDELSIRAFVRRPTDKEKQELVAIVAADPNPQQALEDCFWAILNSREFVFNH